MHALKRSYEFAQRIPDAYAIFRKKAPSPRTVYLYELISLINVYTFVSTSFTPESSLSDIY